MRRVVRVIRLAAGSSVEPPLGIGTGVGFAAAIGASLLAVGTGGARHPDMALVVFAMATMLVALRCPLPDGLATAGVCWLFMNGFALNAQGQLSWHGSPDLVRIAVLVATALVARFAGWQLRNWPGTRVPGSDTPLSSDDLRPAA